MVYLDHNATSPLRACARDAVLAALADCGNASSVHGSGRRARRLVEDAREKIAAAIGAEPGSMVFVSGGSEANALALKGAVAGALAAENRITRIVVSAIEHESVRANALSMAETIPGVKVGTVPVTKEGTLDLEALRLLLMQGKGRVLVSIMAANNETGVIQDLAEVRTLLAREGGKDALLHVDAVQAFGRMELSFKDVGADYMSISAHKLGGPQGIGALIVKERAPLSPLIAGGGQERGRRAGTENVAAIAGFGAAVQDLAAGARAEALALADLRDRFEAGLRRLAPDALIFGAEAPRLPNTSNFAIAGLAAEMALIALDLDGICISSGAACSSGKVAPSHVLKAMGFDESIARSALRVSFGWTSRSEDVDAVLAGLERAVSRLQAAKAA